MEPYDFGLTKEQQSHARELHDEAIVIDMLFQGPIGTYSLPESLEEELQGLAQQVHPHDEVARVNYASKLIRKWYTNGRLSNLYKACWYESGITAACRQLAITSQDSLMRSMANIQAEFDYHPWLVKARTAADIAHAHESGLKAGIVTSQETVGYGKDLGLLELAYDFGLRVQQLTYNNHNFIGAGCMEPNDAGLSKFGMEFVGKCNELGVVVDISHCGRRTTLDACKHSAKPVVATMNTQKPPFDNRNVRLAMAYATDKEGLAIVKGGSTVIDSMTPSMFSTYYAPPNTPAFDLYKAKQLLAAEGYNASNPLRFEAWVYGGNTSVPEAYQAILRSIGVDMSIKHLEFGVFLEGMARGEYQMLFGSWNNTTGDPLSALENYWSGSFGSQNISFFENERVDELYNVAKATADEEVLKAAAKEVQEIAAAQMPIIPTFSTLAIFAVDKRLKGVKIYPSSIFSFRDAYYE